MRLLCLVVLVALIASPIEGQSLRGSRSSVMRMYHEAEREDFTFLTSRPQALRFVNAGLLVRLTGNRNYAVLGNVAFPYVRPATKLFVERFSAQMRSVCGERLVVTSATRTTVERPRNGSHYSVHPTGMAVDLRLPPVKCRRWVESTMLELEKSGVLEAIRENHPPHYHIAVFPTKYDSYVDVILGRVVQHVVRRGDTLSELAEQYKTTIERIKKVNGLRSNGIRVGQRLTIPRS